MNPKLWELIMIVVVAFGLGFWQLHDVTKSLKNDRKNAEKKEREKGADPGGDKPEGAPRNPE